MSSSWYPWKAILFNYHVLYISVTFTGEEHSDKCIHFLLRKTACPVLSDVFLCHHCAETSASTCSKAPDGFADEEPSSCVA